LRSLGPSPSSFDDLVTSVAHALDMRDFNLHKGIAVPIPSPNGIIGIVGVAGPHFDEREIHKPVLHLLSLHVFHRLEHLSGRRFERRAGLTEREREVMAWGAEGKTAWEIGCILGISHRTVEAYFQQACKKLGASNRIQAVAMCGRRLQEHEGMPFPVDTLDKREMSGAAEA
jgi:LuxR family transcriptional regulator, quorum-sensing system regulator BjaR1